MKNLVLAALFAATTVSAQDPPPPVLFKCEASDFKCV